MTLRREEFEAWLKAHGPTSIVGERTNPCRCPLAQWLFCRNGRGAQVLATSYQELGTFERYAPGEWTRLPPWAVAFVARLEARSRERYRRVRAATALRILRAIPEEAGR
jgi:hypothetical protein